MLVKRTSSSSPSHRPWLPHLQGNGLQAVSPGPIPPIAPPAPHILGGPDHRHLPSLSTANPSHVPAGGPSVDGSLAPHTEPASSSMAHYKAFRRPRGSLTNNSDLKKQAHREDQARYIQRIRAGVQMKKKTAGGPRVPLTAEEYQAVTRSGSRRIWSNRSKESKAKIYQRVNESSRRVRAKRKAQRQAQLEGRAWEGSPVRKPGRPRQYWDQEQEQEQVGAQEVRQPVLAETRTEKAPQHAVDVPHIPPGTHGGTLRLGAPASSSVSWPVTQSPFHGTSHQQFAPGPPSPLLVLRLPLSAPDSSPFGHRQTTRTPRQVAPPAARSREEERLQLTLAPPGEHDRLGLTLAPPWHD